MAKRTPVWDAAIRREKAKKYSKRFTDKQRAAYWKKKYLACKKKYDADQRFMRSIV